jgi:peptide/nickel transport system permease protein
MLPQAAVSSGEGAAEIGSETQRLRRAIRAAARNRLTLAGAVIAALFLAAAALGPYITPHNPTYVNLNLRLLPPGPGHLLGTDELGRDILSRILAGARGALEVAVLVLAIAAGIGLAVGAAAALGSRWLDDLLMRVTDMFLAFPALVLAMAVAAALGPSLTHAMLAMAVVWWPWYARLVRGQVLSLKERGYVEAAQALGATWPVILWRHMLPNMMDALVVQLTMDVGNVILTAASLAFVGLGAQPPAPDWGLMVASGRLYALGQWWVPTFPGLAILVVVLAFNLLGDGLRDVLDPTLQGTD